ncbi:MAG: hypothetical protein QW524_02555 [Candidatus Woesearchaeota archaeon]
MAVPNEQKDLEKIITNKEGNSRIMDLGTLISIFTSSGSYSLIKNVSELPDVYKTFVVLASSLSPFFGVYFYKKSKDVSKQYVSIKEYLEEFQKYENKINWYKAFYDPWRLL